MTAVRHRAFARALTSALAKSARLHVAAFVRAVKADDAAAARAARDAAADDARLGGALLKVRLLRAYAARRTAAEAERIGVGRAVEAGEVAALGRVLGLREGRAPS
jgi:hypothetical protein